MTLFGPADHPLLDEVRGVDLDATTPLDAIRLIAQWQEDLAEEKERASRHGKRGRGE
jgi:DNA mismatch repair protein MutS